MEFKGKMDKWYYLIILAVNAVLIPLCFVSQGGFRKFLFIPLLIMANILVDAPVFVNKVVIEEDVLRIDFGAFRNKLLIENISAVRPEHGSLSLCSASNDQLAIAAKEGTFRIATTDNQGLAKELKKRNRKMHIYI